MLFFYHANNLLVSKFPKTMFIFFAGLPYQNLSTQFEEFLFRTGRYPSLQFSDSDNNSTQESISKKRLLLLEDLPDHIVREPLNFRDILRWV